MAPGVATDIPIWKGDKPSSDRGSSGQNGNLRRRPGEREKQMRQMCGQSGKAVA